MNRYLGIFVISLIFVSVKADEIGVVKIQPDVSERFVRKGDSLSVNCTVAVDNQQGKLTWKPPTLDEHTEITEKTGVKSNVIRLTAHLSVNNINEKHLGVYTCSYGSSSASFTIRSPTEARSVANYTYGDTSATLSCNISGAADSKTIEKVEWVKNDTLVSDLPDHDRFTVVENRTLVISKPKREDADLYIARFYFKDTDTPYDCPVEYTATPLVLDFDKSKNLIEDDPMDLQCKVKGYPRAEVIWKKNNKPVNVTSRIKLTPLNGYKNARLYIKNAQFDDAGDYTCEAFSSYFNQSDSKTLVVRVKDKLAALWPFLGIVGEVILLCTIIFFYERRRNKQAESEANNAQDADSSSLKKEGVRHRGQKK